MKYEGLKKTVAQLERAFTGVSKVFGVRDVFKGHMVHPEYGDLKVSKDQKIDQAPGME